MLRLLAFESLFISSKITLERRIRHFCGRV